MRQKRPFLSFMQRIPLRWRLALLSLGLLTVLLGALGLIVSAIAQQVLVTNEVSVLQNEARVAVKGVIKDFRPQNRPFSAVYHFYPPGPPPPGFAPAANSLLHALVSPDTNTYAAILSPTGGTFLSGPYNLSPTVAPALVLQVIQTTNPYVIARSATGGRQFVVFIPLVNNLHTVGILQISTPTTPVDDFLTPFHQAVFFGIIGTVVLAIILIFPLVSVALRPLVEIERTSRRIAQGELSMRIDSPPIDDEIGRLARSFNRMVAQLEVAFQRQKRFVADVSHELRTPLTALSGSLEMLLLGADRGNIEASHRLTRGMYAEVQRMHRMVEDLLALTRLDEGKLALRKEVIDVETVLSIVYEQAEYLAHGQNLCCTIEPGIPSVCVDRDRLQQVLLNLVDNALKFTPPGGRVELRAGSDRQKRVTLAVSDTGQGIAPEALPYVFDRFYRADPSRSRPSQQAGGSGLGLAIAKELIKAQGGTITISSTPGQGTTVTICFPAVLPPENASDLKRGQELSSRGARRNRLPAQE